MKKIRIFLGMLMVAAMSNLAQSSEQASLLVNPEAEEWFTGPLMYYGYAFSDGELQELKLMAEDGANMVKVGSVWIPETEKGLFEGPGDRGPEDFRNIKMVTDPDKAGLSVTYQLGSWNNPGFNYYPMWLFEKYPDIAMLDQDGEKIVMGSLFEDKPAVQFDHPLLVQGIKRHITEIIKYYRDYPQIKYWVMGGESLYPTYLAPDRWTDYSEQAIAHFRRWLEQRWISIDKFNQHFGTRYNSFGKIRPPMEPEVKDSFTLEWLRFRLDKLAEWYQWNYATFLTYDSEKPKFFPMHGKISQGHTLTTLGLCPARISRVVDGIDTSQILSEEDDLDENIFYLEMAASFGKPVAPSELANRRKGKSFSPETVRRAFFEALGMGAVHVGLVNWRTDLPDGKWSIKGTEAQTEVRKLFHEIKTYESKLVGLWPVTPQVGVYLSEVTWLREGFLEEWLDLHQALIKANVNKVYLFDLQFLEHRLPASKVIVSFDNYIMDSKVISEIAQFVSDGGILITNDKFAKLDERLQRPEAHPLLSAVKQVVSQQDKGVPYGRGRIYFWERPEIGEIRKSIASLKEEGIFLRKAEVEATFKDIIGVGVRRIKAYLSGRLRNNPVDFSAGLSLGQTFVSQGSYIHSIEFTTPTWFGKGDRYSNLQIELLTKGPQGKVLAKAKVDREQIVDNRRQDIIFDVEVEKGQVYYVRIRPETPITEEERLGWWGYNEDVYPGGSAFIDDQPQNYDQQMNIVYKEAVKKGGEARCLSFLLSDGVNLMAVLVNREDYKIQVSVKPEKIFFPFLNENYQVKELRTEAILGKFDPEKGIELIIPPKEARLVYLERNTTKEEAEKLVKEVLANIERLRKDGFKGFSPGILGEMQNLLGQEEYAKAYALAYRLSSRVGIKIEKTLLEPEIELKINVRDLQGVAVNNAAVVAEVIPLYDYRIKMNSQGDGLYYARIYRKELPKIYDYDNQKYTDYQGPLFFRYSIWNNGNLTQIRGGPYCGALRGDIAKR